MSVVIIDSLSRGGLGTAPFALTKEADVQSSYLTVADLTARDAIPTWQRLPYMRVYVVSTGLDYRLDNNINTNVWTTIPTGAGVYQPISEKGQPNGYVPLDATGHINPAYITSIYSTNAYVVTDNAARNALTTLTGNLITVTSTSKIFVKMNNNPPTNVDADFAELTLPGVLSVNGNTGAVSVTIANLLTYGTGATDFNNQVAIAPAVTSLSATVSTHTSQISVNATNIASTQTYAENHVGLATLTSIAKNPTGAQTGYALVWNGSNYDLQLITGGGGGGSMTASNGLNVSGSDIRLGGSVTIDGTTVGDLTKGYIYYDNSGALLGYPGLLSGTGDFIGGTAYGVFQAYNTGADEYHTLHSVQSSTNFSGYVDLVANATNVFVDHSLNHTTYGSIAVQYNIQVSASLITQLIQRGGSLLTTEYTSTGAVTDWIETKIVRSGITNSIKQVADGTMSILGTHIVWGGVWGTGATTKISDAYYYIAAAGDFQVNWGDGAGTSVLFDVGVDAGGWEAQTTNATGNSLIYGTGTTLSLNSSDLTTHQVRLTFDITAAASAVFLDTRATTRGIEYNADYSAGYTSRSLVDKAFVWATKGISTLTASTTIEHTSANELTFLNTTNNSRFSLFDPSGVNAPTWGASTILWDAGTGIVPGIIIACGDYTTNTTDSTGISAYLTSVGFTSNNTGGTQTVSFDIGYGVGGSVFTDGRTTPTGLQYAADYSTNYTARSLVDSGYVVAKAKSYTAKQSFPVTSTTAGLGLTANASDPTTNLAAGDMYYQTGVGVRVYSGSAWSTLGAGGGTIGGSIAVNQVAVGSGTNTITGNASFTYVNATGLTVDTALLTGSTSFNIVNTTATTVNIAGAATTFTLGNTATAAQTVSLFTASTGTSTYSFATGATTTGLTKTINIGTSGATGSTTAINIGTGLAGTAIGNINLGSTNAASTLTINNSTIVNGNATLVLFNTTSTNISFAGAATTLTIGATTGTLTLNNPTVVGQGTTATLWNTTNTTVNFAGAATTLAIGATTGTATIANATVTFSNATTVNVNGVSPTFASTSTGTLTFFNTNLLTVAEYGAATTYTIGGTPTGAVTANFFNNATSTGNTKTINIGTSGATGSTTAINIGTGGAGTAQQNINLGSASGGSITVNSATVSTSSTSMSLFTSTATTVSFASAATTLGMGATTGTATINNPNVVGSQTTVNLWNATSTIVNFAGAATTLAMGAATGTATIANATFTLSNATTVNVNGASPTFASTSTGTLTFFNTNLLTVTEYGAATSYTLGGTPTGTVTANFFTNATAAATTKTINFGTGGAASSTTNINIGSASGGTITANTRIQLSPNATVAGMNIGSVSSVPSSAAVGDFYFLTSVGGYYGKRGAVDQAFLMTTNGLGGSGGVPYQNADNLTVASSATFLYSVSTGLTLNDGLISTTTTFNLINTVATTVNFAGAATTFTLGGTPTTALTANLFTNATAAATTKTINLGTGGAASSTTNINIGSANGGLITANSRVLTTYTATTAPLTLAGGTTDPSSPNTGDMYYNTTGNTIKYYNGSTWATVTTGGGGGDMVLASAQTSTGKKTFSVSGGIAGINVGANASDPTTTLAAGDMYYQTSVGLRVYDGAAWNTVGSGGGGWATTGTTTLTGNVTITGAFDINLGNDTGARTYSFGNGQVATGVTQTINIGNGGATGTGVQNINIGSGVLANGTSQTIQIGVNSGSGASSTQAIYIGSNSSTVPTTITTYAYGGSGFSINATTMNWLAAGGTFSVATSTASTINFLNSNTVTNFNIGNATTAQTITIGGSSTATGSIYNLGTGVTGNGFTKTLNIGTGGASGSTTNVNIGSQTAGALGTTNFGNNNIGLCTLSPSFGGGAEVLFIGNVATAPTSDPTGGALYYIDGNNDSHLMTRKPSGDIIDLEADTIGMSMALRNVMTMY